MANKKILGKLAAVAAALCVWQLGAVALGQRLLLVTPVEVARRLAELAFEEDFAAAVLFSLCRIVGGFALGFCVAAVLAVCACGRQWVETMLWPYMAVIKSVPVASFIILSLIWLGSEQLSVFIAFLMVLPVVYTNLLTGLKSADGKLLEMAAVFRMGFGSKVKYIYLPALKPYVLSALSVSAGLAWKAGVAAEVIGIPDGSMGEKLYESKIYLCSADLFAWTVVIVVLSVGLEKLLVGLVRWSYGRLERG